MGESKEDNDLFFTCSLIEYIARKTQNKKKTIIEQLGKEGIEKIYQLAEIYHCEPIEKVGEEWIIKKNIQKGTYDPVSQCTSRIPTYFEMGKIYKSLIKKIDAQPNHYIETLYSFLSSWLIEKLDNYNSSLYYENISYLYACYQEGKIL